MNNAKAISSVSEVFFSPKWNETETGLTGITEAGDPVVKFHLLNGASRNWHQFDCRRSRAVTNDGVDDAGSITAVLCAVGCIDLIVDARIGFFYKCDVFFHTTCVDMSFVSHQDAAKPSGCAPVYGPNI
jgi:hypothetical protein